MTREDIICMARKAGFEIDCCSLEWHDRIESFAALVAAAEREECIRIMFDYCYSDVECEEAATLIRARRNK